MGVQIGNRVGLDPRVEPGASAWERAKVYDYTFLDLRIEASIVSTGLRPGSRFKTHFKNESRGIWAFHNPRFSHL